MAKPPLNEIPEFYQPYIKALPDNMGLLNILVETSEQLTELLTNLPEKMEGYRYAEGKWTIKEVIQHIIDTERVFAYRAMTFARGDKTDLPGFDQNEYVREYNTEERSLTELIREFENIRISTLDLFRSLSKDHLQRAGTANGYPMNVKILGYIIAGHQAHHTNIIRERYLEHID